MTSNPPPYAPEETKGLYPSVQGDPQQMMQMQPMQQPGVYYQPQGSPAAPGAQGVSTVTYYPSGPAQPQPQPMVISQPAPVIVATHPHTPSLICHIVLACFVTWCCCCPCGFIAFILAVIGQCSGSPSTARQLGISSIVFSIIGIMITVIVIIVMFITGVGLSVFTYELYKATGLCAHYMDGECYMYKEVVLSRDECESKAAYGTVAYENDYCYYNSL